MSSQVIHLYQHVCFCNCLPCFFRSQAWRDFPGNPPSCLRVMQPLADSREVIQSTGIHESFHGPAVGMTADDDVADAEMGDGVLDRRCFSAGYRAMRRNQVTGISQHEEIAWL